MSKNLTIFAWIFFIVIAIFVINEVENMKAEKAVRHYFRIMFESDVLKNLND